MRYRVTSRFSADYDRLSVQEKKRFREVVQVINDAYARREDKRIPHWPSRLRIKRVEGVEGIWELTWSFSGPDGRATFEYFTAANGEVGIRWRRIGGHEVFRDP